MNSVLIQLQIGADVHKRQLARKNEFLKRQVGIMRKPKVLRDVYKRVGLYNIDDPEFYGDSYILEKTLQIENMCLAYALFHTKYYKPLDHSADIYSTVTEIPVVVFGLDVFLFELKKPFDKPFFEKLINHQCDLMSFGDEYIKFINGKYYATVELFTLFVFQKNRLWKKST